MSNTLCHGSHHLAEASFRLSFSNDHARLQVSDAWLGLLRWLVLGFPPSRSGASKQQAKSRSLHSEASGCVRLQAPSSPFQPSEPGALHVFEHGQVLKAFRAPRTAGDRIGEANSVEVSHFQGRLHIKASVKMLLGGTSPCASSKKKSVKSQLGGPW